MGIAGRSDNRLDAQAEAGAPRPRARRRWLRRLLWLPVWCVAISVLQVALLRFVDPTFTSFMAIRQFEAWAEGDWSYRTAYDWRDADRISVHLPVALVAAEDQKFAHHRGFDLDAIQQAHDNNARGKRIRGGSTISQQLAKNLFLWSGGGFVRKGIEAWYTVLIETLWPKKRILEMYSNVVEFGDGVYGAQAASRTYFRKDASGLSPAEAARLAAVLPNPKRYSVARPGPYVQSRSRSIQRNAARIGGPAYVQALD